MAPPNRIEDGRFIYGGRTYQLPINETDRNNHIHGYVSNAPFQVIDEGKHGGATCVKLRYSSAIDMRYASQDLRFTIILYYRLFDGELIQTLFIKNDENIPLPIGLGQHTALCVPFFPNAHPEDYRIQIPVKEEWLLDRVRILPTGKVQSDSALCKLLRRGQLIPCAQPLSSLFRLEGSCVKLMDLSSGSSVSMSLFGYPFIMLWNQGGSHSFVCCEPQTWATNAPRLSLGQEETGFFPLFPEERRVYTIRWKYNAP